MWPLIIMLMAPLKHSNMWVRPYLTVRALLCPHYKNRCWSQLNAVTAESFFMRSGKRDRSSAACCSDALQQLLMRWNKATQFLLEGTSEASPWSSKIEDERHVCTSRQQCTWGRKRRSAVNTRRWESGVRVCTQPATSIYHTVSFCLSRLIPH